MFRKENTVYYIQYDHVVDSAGIQIPSGCILNFIGGKLSGGHLVSNNTIIIDSYNTKPVENIDIYGYFKYYSIFDCYNKEEISDLIYNKDEIDNLVNPVVTLGSKPGRSTLTYTSQRGKTLEYKLGDKIRVKDSTLGLDETNGYVYYELYDVVEGEAYWRLYSPIDFSDKAFISDTGYGRTGYNKYITNYEKQNIFPYTTDSAVLDGDGNNLQTRLKKYVNVERETFTDAEKAQARSNIGAAKAPVISQVIDKDYYEINF